MKTSHLTLRGMFRKPQGEKSHGHDQAGGPPRQQMTVLDVLAPPARETHG